MHIFFSGIGGSGIGALALIAKQAGHTVSGSDKQDSEGLGYLKSHGIEDVYVGQTEAAIAAIHTKNPIDWYVYSSALPKENPNHPELVFVESQGIKHSKRDQLLNQIIADKNLKLIAIAGTHGKSTTTAMVIWLFKELGLPISYSIGAKIGFGDSGQLDPASQYFAYECDEFDRNFLAFRPYVALISGIAWDHHEIFPSEDDYNNAFKEFLGQSEHRVIWDDDYEKIAPISDANYSIMTAEDEMFSRLKLVGEVNRRDAWAAVKTVAWLTSEPLGHLIDIMNEFPGLTRRMEQLKPNLYTDYAHNPEKITGAMQTALEMAREKQQKVVVVYEPLTNRRMHYTRTQHKDVFNGASALYWVPSYLAREDPSQAVLTPAELIQDLDPSIKEIAKPMELNDQLKAVINSHLAEGDIVLALSGGGGNSLDEWLRKEF